MVVASLLSRVQGLQHFPIHLDRESRIFCGQRRTSLKICSNLSRRNRLGQKKDRMKREKKQTRTE
jgi:hypothetical protein